MRLRHVEYGCLDAIHPRCGSKQRRFPFIMPWGYTLRHRRGGRKTRDLPSLHAPREIPHDHEDRFVGE